MWTENERGESVQIVEIPNDKDEANFISNEIQTILSSSPDRIHYKDIAVFYRALQKNPEFRMRFADRVQIHYFNGGALTDENVLRRFREMKELVSGVLRNLNSSVETSWVPRRRAIVMSQMATQNIQASDNAPQFSQSGGAIPAGYSLKLTSPDGEIYYTLNGSDPRRPGEVAETGKIILAGSAEKWVLVPSADNGGDALGNNWWGARLDSCPL